MNNDIKEILDKCTPYLFGDEVDKLLGCITNSQKENKDLKIKLDMEKKINSSNSNAYLKLLHTSQILEDRIDKLNTSLKDILEYTNVLRQLIQDNPPALTSLHVLEEKIEQALEEGGKIE